MYGIIKDGNLIKAPKVVVIGDKVISNPTDKQIISLGYKEVKMTEQPQDAPKGKMYVSSYEDKETHIEQIWEIKEIPMTIEDRVTALENTIVGSI